MIMTAFSRGHCSSNITELTHSTRKNVVSHKVKGEEDDGAREVFFFASVINKTSPLLTGPASKVLVVVLLRNFDENQACALRLRTKADMYLYVTKCSKLLLT